MRRIPMFLIATALGGVVFSLGCEQPPPAPPATAAQTVPAPAPLPESVFSVVPETEDKAVAELNRQREAIIAQVLERRGLTASDVKIRLGEPGQTGLEFEVTLGGRVETRSIPVSTYGAELVTNFDHTLDSALKALQNQP